MTCKNKINYPLNEIFYLKMNADKYYMDTNIENLEKPVTSPKKEKKIIYTGTDKNGQRWRG